MTSSRFARDSGLSLNWPSNCEGSISIATTPLTSDAKYPAEPPVAWPSSKRVKLEPAMLSRRSLVPTTALPLHRSQTSITATTQERANFSRLPPCPKVGGHGRKSRRAGRCNCPFSFARKEIAEESLHVTRRGLTHNRLVPDGVDRESRLGAETHATASARAWRAAHWRPVRNCARRDPVRSRRQQL